MESTSLDKKSKETSWSKKQILGHLIDSAVNNHRRFKIAMHQSHLIFDGYTQDDEVKLHDYQHREWTSIVSLFSELNLHIASLILVLKDIDLNAWHDQHNYDRIGFQRVDSSDRTTLAYLVLDYISHIEHHLTQIIPDYTRILLAYSNDPIDYNLSD